MKNQNLVIMLGLLLLVLVLGGFYFLSASKKSSVPTPEIQKTNLISPSEEKPVLPTRTPEEIAIIAKIKDHYVDITAKGFEPETVTVKTHDQVFWTNKDTKQHKVAGENWGNVPINPGERFVQAFKEPGTYKYSCALHPEEEGTIIVEE